MRLNIKEDIQSLSTFKRETPRLLKRLKKSGAPLVLTVNGKAEVVVHDAAEYAKFLELREFAETVYGVQKGLDSMKQKKGVEANKFFSSFFKKHKISEK